MNTRTLSLITVATYISVASLIIYALVLYVSRSNLPSDQTLVLGLSILDITLLVLCPGASALGLAVAGEVKKTDGDNDLETVNINSPLIGLALGLVVSLYFIGSLQNNISSAARILALCILLGYQAPNVWYSQEKALKKLIDKKLKNAKPEL